MNRGQTTIQARRRSDNRHCHDERQRRNVAIRRVAVVQPGGSHFKLLPVRASHAVTDE
jgi:hypothetical protein